MKMVLEGVNENTEPSSAVAEISYQIENARAAGMTEEQIQIAVKQIPGFPPNLKYVSSMYDPGSGNSACAFEDTTTNETVIGVAGTNMDNGIFDTLVDFKSDINTAFSPDSAENSFYKSLNQYVEQTNSNHYVSTITGHSKGGRDAAIVGMHQQVPTIVTYNGSPLNNPTGESVGNLFRAAQGPFSMMFQVINDVQTEYDRRNYKGHVFNFRSNKDPLTGIAIPTGSKYDGKSVLINNGHPHDMKYFMGSDEQKTIKKTIKKHDPLKDRHNKKMKSLAKAESQAKLSRKKTKSLKKSLLKNGGGLTDAQKIYLDAAEAKTVTNGMITATHSQVKSFKKMYDDAIKEADDLWTDTTELAKTMGPHLSSGEQIAALADVGFTKQEVTTNPTTKYQNVKRKLDTFDSRYTDLLDKINTTADKQVAGDHELATHFHLEDQ